MLVIFFLRGGRTMGCIVRLLFMLLIRILRNMKGDCGAYIWLAYNV